MTTDQPSTPDNASWTSRITFGGFDGATSLVGVLAGLIATHSTPSTILATSAGLAVASAVGMAFGDFLSGANRVEALVMGAATFVGSFLPALPIVLFAGWLGYALAGVILLGMGIAIAEINPQPRRAAYTSTGLMLLFTSALSVGAALLGLLI